MKTLKYSFTVLLLSLCAYLAIAQAPQKFSYQAIVRDNNGAIISNREIGMQISIIQGGENGETVYSEIQTTTTNQNGLFSIEIGTGSTRNNFQSIDWSTGSFFIKTEADLQGGTNYTIEGISQLLSVPYALHAQSASTVNDSQLEIAKGITAVDTARWNASSRTDTIVINNITSRIDTIIQATDTVFVLNETIHYDSLIITNSDTIVIASDTLVIENNFNYYDTLVLSNLDTIILDPDTLIVFNETTIYDTVYSFNYDTIVLASDTLIVQQFIYDTIVMSHIDTVILASDTLTVYNETTIFDSVFIFNSDTIVVNNQSTIYDTVIIEHFTSRTDTLLMSSTDTIVLNTIATIYDTVFSSTTDTLMIRQYDTITLAYSDTAFINSAAFEITDTDIETIRDQSGINTGDQDLSQLATQEALADSIAALRIENTETDPLFSASTASGITEADTARWNNGNSAASDLAAVLATGNDADSLQIKNLADPTDAQDAATKAYIDVLIARIEQLEQLVSETCGVLDVEGNAYTVVKIGSQIWMRENLRTTKYNNGTDIPLIEDGSDWARLETPGVCWYDNDLQLYKETHGALYNWWAAAQPNICPVGWHVPTDDDWKGLEISLGIDALELDIFNERGTNQGSQIAGRADYWNDGNLEEDPGFGQIDFNGYTAGLRVRSGSYANYGVWGTWWSSSEYTATESITRALGNTNTGIYRFDNNKKSGYAIRCLKD